MKIDTFWKKSLSFLFLPTFVLTANASAAQLSFTSDTIIRFFERDTSAKEDAQVIPIYEYLQLDYGDPEAKGFSFHGYGWGRADLAGDDFFDDNEDGELLYGYLEYAHAKNNLNVKLGRQYVFHGIANESMDGIRADGDFTPFFTLSVYGGLPVTLDKENGRSGDRILGGKISHHLRTLYNVGISYKQIYNDDNEDEEIIGIDLSVTPQIAVSLYGLSSWNLIEDTWAEHSYEVPFSIADLDFRPFFQRFDYEGMFNKNANSADPFRFLAGTDETITALGGDIIWRKSAQWDLAFKIKGYEYDIRDDNSLFYSGLLTWHGEELTQIGGEFGIMEGDTAENDYVLLRALILSPVICSMSCTTKIFSDKTIPCLSRWEPEFFSLTIRWLSNCPVITAQTPFSTMIFALCCGRSINSTANHGIYLEV